MSNYVDICYAGSGIEWVVRVYHRMAIRGEVKCFGCSDSKSNKRDAVNYYQIFVKRNQKSNRSKVSKDKVTELIVQGLIHHYSDCKMIRMAKKLKTRNKILEESITLSEQNLKANHNIKITR